MKYFAICGEPSGDLHLSYLIEALKKQNLSIEFSGVCGAKSEALGMKKILDIREISVMGIFNVIKKIRFLKRKALSFLDYIEEERITHVLLIDYGGFNLAFVKQLRHRFQNRVKIVYYIPPKLWVWGKKRIHTLKMVDHIMVIFPWEKSFYEKENTPVVYFGNPLVDQLKPVERVGNKILLLPGSRTQELKAILPVMKGIVLNSQESFILKVANQEDLPMIQRLFLPYENVEVVINVSLVDLSRECRSAIATSGTVVLECALLNLPTILLYKMDKVSEWIFKTFIKFPFLGLPNIAMNRFMFPELLQEQCEPLTILRTLKKLEEHDLTKDFNDLRALLGREAILEKISQYLYEIVKKDEQLPENN